MNMRECYLIINERFKSIEIRSLQSDLNSISNPSVLINFMIRTNVDCMSKKVGNNSYVLRIYHNLSRDSLRVSCSDNHLFFIYNPRFDVLTVEHYSGDLDFCKEMIPLLERLVC